MDLLKKIIMPVTLACTLLAASQAQAANWLMLQGTEETGQASRVNLWGFIQAQYQYDNSDANAAGRYIPEKLVAPDLTSQKDFNINRARIGVRGTVMQKSSKINYLALLEFGNNAITEPGNSIAKAIDASITLNYIPGARIRTGLFKTPGAEEGLQDVQVSDYINFTSVSSQLLLELFPNQNYTPNIPAQPVPVNLDLQGFDRSVSAFRDFGIQVFDSFLVGTNKDWDLSYALMIGNGNGLSFPDNNKDKEFYGYVSAEKILNDTKGSSRDGMKFLAWTQNGKRYYDGNNDGISEKYNRDRWGYGFKFKRKAWRATAEYMAGDGMIMVGVNRPSFGIGSDAGKPGAPGNGLKGTAYGYYFEGGYRIGKSNWELDLRYDALSRLKNRYKINSDTWTLGAQYFFNKKTKMAINFSFRDYKAPNLPADKGVDATADKGPNSNLDGISELLAIQITRTF